MKSSTTQINNPSSFLNLMNIIHLAITLSPFVFASFLYFSIAKDAYLIIPESLNTFLLISLISVLSSFTLGRLLFKKIISRTNRKIELKTKLLVFQTASIVHYALLETSAMLCVIFFMLENNLLFLLIAALPMIFLFALRPTVDKVANALNLDREERRQLQRDR